MVDEYHQDLIHVAIYTTERGEVMQSHTLRSAINTKHVGIASALISCLAAQYTRVEMDNILSQALLAYTSHETLRDAASSYLMRHHEYKGGNL